MKSVLIQAGYQYDPEKKVWQRGSSDGDGSGDESTHRIARLIDEAGDVTTSSVELFALSDDEAILYHLSPLRANLLRPVAEMFSGRVLEIGAGGGAVTRFLGETGGEIVALEPHRGWAGIAAARCRDLANVDVVVDHLHHLPFEPVFDAIVLIGALEEAGRHLPDNRVDPAEELLSRVTRLLKPDGILFVATDNQLSLRRLAGEEGAAGVRFGRRRWRESLVQSGLTCQRWIFPFPDYRMATTLVTEEAFDQPALWRHGVLSGSFYGADRQLPLAQRMAAEELGRAVVSNGMGADLASSFLILASRNGFSLPADAELACHFVSDRRPAYARKIVFSTTPANGLHLRNEPLFPALKADPHYPVETVPEIQSQSTAGRLWSEELRSILSTPEWTIDHLVRWARRWFFALLKRAGLPHQDVPPTATELVPGWLFAARPEKMVVSIDGETTFIDQDLSIRHPLELGYLLFRGVSLTLLGMGKVAPPAAGTERRLIKLIEIIAGSLGIVLTDRDLARYCRYENDVESWISGRRPFPDHEALSLISLETVSADDGNESSEARLAGAIEWCHRLKAENNELYTRLSESRAHLRRLQNDQASLWEWAVQINTHPIRHALKKRAYNLARDTIRSLPFPVALKRRLRDLYFSYIRPLLHRSEVQTVTTAPQSGGLERVRQSMTGSKRDILIFSVIDWHFRVQRPQHIARSLAANGERVFYFSKHFVNAREAGYQIEQISGADSLFRIKLHVKGSPSIYYEPPTGTELKMLEESLTRLCEDLGVHSSVSLIQHPYWYPLVKRLPGSFRVYDCMDHHEGFGDVSDELVTLEKEMLADVDLVTVTSQWLAEFAQSYNQKVMLVRNAVEYDHFAARPERTYVDHEGRRIIGYYGAIAEWFDIELVRAAAAAYPECLVLMVGEDSVGAKRRLADLPNVKFIGEVPYSTLPYYLHAFDVCLLPFRVIPLTLATNPVKVYEYLAAGKPVVSVDLPETAQFGDLVARAGSVADFIAQIGRALGESFGEADQNAARRRQFAAEQTWRHRGASLLKCFPAE